MPHSADIRLLRATAGLCTLLVLAGCAAMHEPSGDTHRAGSPTEANAARQAVERRLDNPPRKNMASHTALIDFYRRRDFKPAWYDPATGKARPVRARFLAYLGHVDRQGLARRDYIDSTTWAALQVPGARRPAALAGQDVALSRAFIRLARDIGRGRVRDASVRGDWPRDSQPVAAADRLAAALGDGDPAAALDALAPEHAGYHRLVDALARYRAIQSAGGWLRIGAGPTLEPGMQDARVPILRRRLRLGGDAERGNAAAPEHARRYTPRLADAVRRFQRRHGLRADGAIGPDTLDALDVPVGARIHTIELNLERWRWMPRDFGRRHIAVNIPDFSLKAVAHGTETLSMPVIVGGTYENRATPVFADRMRYLVFRPFWNVPHGIAVDEIVPHARRDPAYMRRHGYQIVPAFGPHATPLANTPAHLETVVAGRLQIRQAGGRGNALGLVKFMFPNRYAVYLHSTPAEHLFHRDRRDLSHGCVRVADPVALAAFALAGRDDWDMRRIRRAMHADRRRRVNLAEPLPVYLLYWTAFVNADGVNFRRDLYGRDVRLDRALADRPPGAT